MKIFKNKNHLLGVIVLLLLAGGMIALYFTNKDIQHKIILQEIEELQATTNNVSKNLHYFFKKYFGELSFLAELKDIQQLNSTGENLMRVFYEHNKDNISAITRATKEGRIKYTVPYIKSAIGKDISRQKHNQEVMRDHQPLISEVFKAVQGYRTIAFVYPVFNEVGNYDGTITLLLPFATIAREYLDSLRGATANRTFLLSAEGIILYSNNKNDVGKSIFDPTVGKSLADSSISKIIHDGNNSFIFKNVQNQEGEIAVYSQVPLFKSHWVILISTPVKSVLANLHTYNHQFAFILFTLGTGLMLFAFVFYRSRTKAYKKISEQEEFFRTVAKMTEHIIYNYDINTGKIKWEGAITELTQYPEEEFKKFNFQDWLKICHPDEKKFHQFDKEKISRLNQHYTSEYRIRRKDGKFIIVEDNSYFIYNENGEPIKQIGTIKDVTERKKAEEDLLNYQQKLENMVEERTKELEKANKILSNEIEKRKLQEIELRKALKRAEAADKLKQHFLQMISHEFRTPLGAIINYSDLLFEATKKTEDKTILAYKHSIITSSQRIIRTMDSILIMAQLQNDSYEQELENFDLYEDSVIYACEELRINAEQKGNLFIWTNEAGSTLIYQDKFAIDLILKHIIENAIKYTKNGKVEVTVKKDKENGFIVTIADNGDGISEEYLPKIFDLFSQEEGGYKRKYEGSGLGLALVKRLCDKAHIQIDVQSAKNVGTVVTLIIKSFEKTDTKEQTFSPN